MNKCKNPYPEFLIDEASGIEVSNTNHKVMTGGYKVMKNIGQGIRAVIKAPNGMVLVFDGREEQIPEYQGQYEQVKPHILQDAPPSAVFSYAFDYGSELKTVPRDEW